MSRLCLPRTAARRARVSGGALTSSSSILSAAAQPLRSTAGARMAVAVSCTLPGKGAAAPWITRLAFASAGLTKRCYSNQCSSQVHGDPTGRADPALSPGKLGLLARLTANCAHLTTLCENLQAICFDVDSTL